MSQRLPFLRRRTMYHLRGGFQVRPLIIALTLGCAGAAFSWLEEMFPATSSRLAAIESDRVHAKC